MKIFLISSNLIYSFTIQYIRNNRKKLIFILYRILFILYINMNYDNRLINAINSKFSLDVIKQFGVLGSNNFFIISQIGKRFKELIDNFNNEYKKIIDNDLKPEYYLDGICKKMYLKQNNQILNDQLTELLNEEENIDLRNSFEEIINYIDSLPYIENDNDFNNEFIETYLMMTEILNDENIDEYDLEGGISFFEELKNNFRGRNQQAFEYYDKLQEKYYQLLESNFGVKYDNIPDN